jgi:hypothetical protein
MISGCTAALEGLDDDHAAAAAGARMRRRRRFALIGAVSVARLARCRRNVEQLPRSGDVLGSARVGEETVVTDAMSAAWRFFKWCQDASGRVKNRAVSGHLAPCNS